MISTIVSVLIIVSIATLLLMMLIFMLLGLRKGLFGTLITSAVTVGSAILAFVLARLLLPTCTELSVNFVESLVQNEDFTALIEGSEMIRSVFGVLVGGFILPFAFLVFFLLIHLVGSIVCAILLRAFPKGKRLAGMGVGAVRGVIFAIVLIFPMLSLMYSVDTLASDRPVVEEMVAGELGSEEMSAYDECKRLFSEENVMYSLLKDNVVAYGVKGLTSTTVADTTIDAPVALDAIGTIVEMVASVEHSDEGSDEELKAVTSALITTIDESPLLSTLLADFVVPCAEAWMDGKAFCGIDPILAFDENTPFASVYRSVYEALAASTPDTVADNFQTLLDVMFLINDAGTFTLSDAKTVGALLETLGSSGNMDGVVSEIVVSSVQSIAEGLYPEMSSEEAYSAVVSDIETIIRDADMNTEQISADIVSFAAENEVGIPEDVATSLAESLVGKMENAGGVLLEEDLDEVLSEFGSTYGELIREQLPEDFEIPEGYDGDISFTQ